MPSASLSPNKELSQQHCNCDCVSHTSPMASRIAFTSARPRNVFRPQIYRLTTKLIRSIHATTPPLQGAIFPLPHTTSELALYSDPNRLSFHRTDLSQPYFDYIRGGDSPSTQLRFLPLTMFAKIYPTILRLAGRIDIAYLPFGCRSGSHVPARPRTVPV